MAAILSAALMLEHLGHSEAAQAVEEAVAESLREGSTTLDLGGGLTTAEVGDAVVLGLGRIAAGRQPAPAAPAR